MKHIFRSIIVVSILIFSNIEINAQGNIADFTAVSGSVDISGDNISIPSTIAKTGNVLVWRQYANGTSNATEFLIVSATGSWDQGTSLGAMVYQMEIKSLQCTLTLTGSQTGLSAMLTFEMPDAEDENYSFNINTITYQ